MTLPHAPDPIAAIAQQYPALQLVYLFGSRVLGSSGPMSDTDLARSQSLSAGIARRACAALG